METIFHAEYDKSSIGATRHHFIFSKYPKTGYKEAMQQGITGGLYITKDEEIPESIIIILKKAKKGETK